MKHLILTSLLALGLFATTFFVGGCSSNLTSSDLRNDWTPGQYSLTLSKEEYDNRWSRHWHNGWRQVHDDLAFIFFHDSSLKLTKYTLP